MIRYANMIRAPIALFAYKRLNHLKQTIGALMANDLASESELYIFSDGPKDEDDKNDIKEIRNYINSLDGGFKKIHQRYSKENKGLAASIVEGVTDIVNDKGFVIVIEDDVVTSRSFLSYMNDSLEKYHNEKRIMHISGYSFPMKEKLPSIFLSQMPFVWGWATWKRAWNHYNNDAKDLVKLVDQKGRKKFNYDGIFKFTSPLEQNANGLMKTWAVKWQASIFINNGLCLTPFPSFTNNIGHDGTGEHYNRSRKYYNKILSLSLPNTLLDIYESAEGRKAIKKFLKQIKPSLLFLIINKIKGIFKK